MLPAVELVDARHLGLLGLGQRAPRLRAHHVARLLRDHLREDALRLARAVAGVGLQRAAAGEPRHGERLRLRAGPHLVGEELEEHGLPSSEDVAQPDEALLLDGGGDRLGGAARRAVGAAEDDGHERRALGRLDDDVGGDAGVAVLCGLVKAQHADGVREPDAPPA
eukprot:5153119-Prymnesium_polylepis.1